MEDQVVFYYKYKTSPQWGEWRNMWSSFNLTIIVPNHRKLPDELVDPVNPRIQWVKDEDFVKESKYHYIELPSLYHIPFRGPNFSTITLPENCSILIPIIYHDWIHLYTEDTCLESFRLSTNDFYLENSMSLDDWLQQITLQWTIDYNNWDSLSDYEKKRFIGWCYILGEWTPLEKQTREIEWFNNDLLHYDLMNSKHRQSCRLPDEERDFCDAQAGAVGFVWSEGS
jgi:hypothetical protein